MKKVVEVDPPILFKKTEELITKTLTPDLKKIRGLSKLRHEASLTLIQVGAPQRGELDLRQMIMGISIDKSYEENCKALKTKRKQQVVMNPMEMLIRLRKWLNKLDHTNGEEPKSWTNLLEEGLLYETMKDILHIMDL